MINDIDKLEGWFIEYIEDVMCNTEKMKEVINIASSVLSVAFILVKEIKKK